MLKIYYQVASDAKSMETEYSSVNEFLQGQYLEVPTLQDHFKVNKATINGEEVILKDQTIGGLFNLLNK